MKMRKARTIVVSFLIFCMFVMCFSFCGNSLLNQKIANRGDHSLLLFGNAQIVEQTNHVLIFDFLSESADEHNYDIASAHSSSAQTDFYGSILDLLPILLWINVCFLVFLFFNDLWILRAIRFQVCDMLRYIHSMDGKKTPSFFLYQM